MNIFHIHEKEMKLNINEMAFSNYKLSKMESLVLLIFEDCSRLTVLGAHGSDICQDIYIKLEFSPVVLNGRS